MNTYNTEQWVRPHGRITRRAAEEHCKPGPFQASRLLRSMASRGSCDRETPERAPIMSAIYKYERVCIIFERSLANLGWIWCY
jgi:hypothetical protein